MRGNLEFASGWCASCRAQRKLERPSSVWGFGDLVMVVITCGLWIIPKMAMRQSYICHECGTKTFPGGDPPA